MTHAPPAAISTNPASDAASYTAFLNFGMVVRNMYVAATDRRKKRQWAVS